MSTQMRVRPNAQVTKSSAKASTDTQLMTSAQSLGVVRTLIQTGIGVITYLRGIFPDECFNDDKIGPDRSEVQSREEAIGSEASKKSGREGRGYIKVKNIKRGASKESDQVLDYLDEGVMDAIQRGFLRQLLFAMYLDPEKPRDVIECYTFNFTYGQNTDGSGTLVPELEVRDQLRSLSLGGRFSMLNDNDPQKARKTCGMVKRQVQALIKNLICSTQSLSDINGRRFLSFKLHYNERVPPDYEPPNFCSADVERDRFTFGTAAAEEIPSTTEMGKVDTGFHSVRVALATISSYLPDAEHSLASGLTSERSQSEIREMGLKAVREEAKGRSVVWDTEKILAPSSPSTPIGQRHTQKDYSQPKAPVEPIGRRDSAGDIIPLSRSTKDIVTIIERKAETNNHQQPETVSTLASTQTERQSQNTPTSGSRATDALHSSLKSSLWLKSLDNSRRQAVDTDSEISQLIRQAEEHENMIQPSSSILYDTPRSMDIPKHGPTSIPDSFDPIESFPLSQPHAPKPTETQAADFIQQTDSTASRGVTRCQGDNPKQAGASKKVKISKATWPKSANTSEICECKDAHDDQDMVRCEICTRWRHLPCYGYKSVNDPRIPVFFVCYRCRIHKGMALEDIWRREDDIQIALEALRGLCIFRRTLAVIYQEGLPTNIKTLALRLEVEFPTATQIKNRLASENFIVPKASIRAKTSRKSGILESEKKNSSQRTQVKKQGGYMSSMVVNQAYEQKKQRDKVYFTPGTGLEAQILKKFGSAEDRDIDDLSDDTTISREANLKAKEPSPANEHHDASGATPDFENPNLEHNSNVLCEETQRRSHARERSTESGSRSGSGRSKHGQRGDTDSSLRNGTHHYHPYRSSRAAFVPRNKVSIGAKEVEVVGVSWDDCDE